MFAHVEIATAGNAARLTVPASAVIDTGDRQVVLVVLGEGKYKPQAVKLGLRGLGVTELLGGLGDTEVLVLPPSVGLGRRVRPAPSGS